MTRTIRLLVKHYLVLPLGALVALAWANSSPESYFRFAHTLSFVINDVGMALFFALVTKEVIEAAAPGGALHTWRRVTPGVVAAAGGTAGAVIAYLGYLQLGDEWATLSQGWPVVCATDIVFCYFIGRSVCRRSAIPFLLLVAIASDVIGLIIVELRCPVADLHLEGLALVVVAIATAIVLRACDVRSYWPYMLIAGPLSWCGLYWSGLHPALALVPIVPFLTHPARARGFFGEVPPGARDALSRFERRWRYPIQIVLLLFALVNAGVVRRGVGTGTWAVLAAALVGRPIGTLIALAVAVAVGLRLPSKVNWRDMIVVAFTSSIGFTFALFFATTAFAAGPLLAEAKSGALLTMIASVPAFAAARLLRIGRFAKSAKRRRDVPGMPAVNDQSAVAV